MSTSRIRFIASVACLAAPAACTGGVNAGKQGGVAFIGLTVMLLVILAILWFVIGRED